MSSLALPTTASGLSGPREAGVAAARMKLLPAADGWALVDLDGNLVFHALGVRGRRQCLEFARTHGVLALFS